MIEGIIINLIVGWVIIFGVEPETDEIKPLKQDTQIEVQTKTKEDISWKEY